MKRFVVVLLLLCMALTLFACKSSGDNQTNNNSIQQSGDNNQTGAESSGSSQTGGNSNSQQSGTASTKDSLSIAITQDGGTLDPTTIAGYDIMNAIRMIYDSLWDYDIDGNVIWKLATGLTMVEPTKWHIHLREGVTFSNGNPFNADDALFSIWWGNGRPGKPVNFPELDLDNTFVVDEYTVELNFFKYDISYVYGMRQLYMFDKESYDEDDMAIHPIGTGPYVLSDYVINSHLNLTARDDYWGGKPAIQHLNFRILAEDAQRVNALQTGEVDIADIPFQDVSFVETLNGINVDVFTAASNMALYFNVAPTSVFYDNTDARRAVAMAIDRQAIADIAYSGFATPSRLPQSMGCSGIESRFLDLGIYGTGYNPEQAKALAQSSGLVDMEILLINNGSSADVVTCELIQENLRAIGVTVDVRNLDPGSWISYIFDDTTYDMSVDGVFAPSQTLAQNYYAWVLYGVGGAFTRNPWPGQERYLSLIEDIMSISDAKKLSDVTMELTQIHEAAMLWFGLIDTQRATAYKSGLVGFQRLFSGTLNYSKYSWGS